MSSILLAKMPVSHFKLLKLKIMGLGIDPNSREAITAVECSLTWQLGNWEANHADKIFGFDSIDSLAIHVRVSFSNEDSGDKK